MDDGGVRTLIAIFGHPEQILAPLAIPEADDGEEPHIHREATVAARGPWHHLCICDFFHMFLHATSILILGMYMQFTISRNLQIYFIFPNSSQIKVSASWNLLFSEKNSELSLKCLMVVYRRSARKCHYLCWL